MTITICDKEYEFNTPYELEGAKFNLLESINTVLAADYNCAPLPHDFDMSPVLQRNCSYGYRGRLLSRIKKYQADTTNHDISKYVEARVAEIMRAHEANIKFTVVFKLKFNWPAGLFKDGTKCWHSYNHATPVLLQDNGAIWLNIYNQSGAPIARAGYYRVNENQCVFFDATGVIIGSIVQLFENDVWKRKSATGYYNDGKVSRAGHRIFYFCGAMTLVKDNVVPETRFSFDETEYSNTSCTCGSWYVAKYKKQHVHGFSHEIGEEYTELAKIWL